MTRRAAARLAGLSERTAQRAAREAGIPGRAELLTAMDAAMVATHAEGLTGAAIAARLCITRHQLRGRLKGARKRTGLALRLVRPARTRGPSHAEAAAARDAALVAAHAEDPTSAGMAMRLGIARQSVRDRIARVRERTGLALRIERPARGLRSERRACPRIAVHPRGTVRDAEPVTARTGIPSTLSRRDAALIAAHGEGLSPQDIAQDVGRSLDYVYGRFWRLRKLTGLPLAFSRKPAQDQIWGEHVRSRHAQVEACLREGLSRRQIADRLGVSLSTVGNFRAKVRAASGESFAPPPRDHPQTRRGEERRRALAAAYAPGVTSSELAAGLGWTVPVVRHHLQRLRADTGQTFTLAPGGGERGTASP